MDVLIIKVKKETSIEDNLKESLSKSRYINNFKDKNQNKYIYNTKGKTEKEYNKIYH